MRSKIRLSIGLSFALFWAIFSFSSRAADAGYCGKFQQKKNIAEASSTAPEGSTPVTGVNLENWKNSWPELQVGSGTQHFTMVNDTSRDIYIGKYFVTQFAGFGVATTSDYFSNISRDFSAQLQGDPIKIGSCEFAILDLGTDQYHQTHSNGRRRVIAAFSAEELTPKISKLDEFYQIHPVLAVGHGLSHAYLYVAKIEEDLLKLTSNYFAIYNVSEDASIQVQNGLESGLPSESKVEISPRGFGFLPMVVGVGRLHNNYKANVIAKIAKILDENPIFFQHRQNYRNHFPLFIAKPSAEGMTVLETDTEFKKSFARQLQDRL